MSKPFFIIGAFRSGTTAIAKILNLATNATVHVEQAPKLSLESRQLYEGKLDDPLGILRQSKEGSIAKEVEKGLIYADKNANYLPFVPYLERAFDCRFLFIVRDGRAVVRSMIDWEKVVPSGFYRRREDADCYQDKSIEEDYWDYSLIRPRPGTPAALAWKSMGHFEKICWYWSAYNEQMFSIMEKVPSSKRRLCFMDRVEACDIMQLGSFLGLEGLEPDAIQNALRGQINSSDARGTVSQPFPDWSAWSAECLNAFTDIAGERMRDLGYWSVDRDRGGGDLRCT